MCIRDRDEKDKAGLASFHLYFARLFVHGAGNYEPWRLQYLTDLTKLPDYEENYFGYGTGSAGAPVDAEGNPVYHRVPKSYEASQTDGERWRWLMARAVEIDPAKLN